MLSVKLHQHIKENTLVLAKKKKNSLTLWLNMFDFTMLDQIVGSFIISDN